MLAPKILLLTLLLLGCWLAGSRPSWAQARPLRVSGSVRDAATNHVLPGVTVRLRRTQQGTVTNAQGDFLLTVLPTDTLLFRAVGYKPYLLWLSGTSLAQLIVQVRLHRDTVRLREVQVTAERADRTTINRALRNLKRPVSPVVNGPQQRKPKPLFAVDSTAPPPPPFGGTPIDLLYEKLSREGKERRKMEAIKAEEARQKAHQQTLEYNKVFKDNKGYE